MDGFTTMMVLDLLVKRYHNLVLRQSYKRSSRASQC
ncbi:MAG: DUF2193 family protein [Methanolobus sp.]